MKTDIGSWLIQASKMLQSIVETPSLTVQVLLANELGVEKTWLVSHPEQNIPVEIIPELEYKLQSLVSGIPLPYVLGYWDFFGLCFQVNSSVLIPRPETELLVETAIQWLNNNPKAKQAIDIGTGSGCITISVAQNHPDVRWLATDISRSALEVAKNNMNYHQLSDRISLLQSNLLAGIQTRFDLICSNPPYIPTPIYSNLAVSRWEPRIALDGGQAGMETITRLLEQATNCITTPGLILCEIEETQKALILDLAGKLFPQADVSVKHDLADKPRLLQIGLQ